MRSDKADARAGEPKILYVVYNLPCPESNAGDWRNYCIIKILAESCRLFIMPVKNVWDLRGPVNLTRASGLKFLYPGVDGAADPARVIRKYGFDAVLFDRHYCISALEEYLGCFPVKIVDTHELQFLKTIRSARFMKEGDAPGWREPYGGRIREIAKYGKADALIAISADEERKLRKYFPRKRIEVIPTCVDAGDRGAAPPGFEGRRNLAYFGSFSGMKGDPNTDAVAHMAESIMPGIRSRLPGVRFDALGFGAGSLRFKGVFTREGITDISRELGKYRVFACPLRFGAGIKKKILDAALAGTPVVTTRIGAEGLHLKNNTDLLIADSTADFIDKTARLYTDRQLWEKLSRNARAKVIERYDMAVMREKLDGLLSSLLRRKRARRTV